MDTTLSEGVTIETISGDVYDQLLRDVPKSFPSGLVRFLPYNQVLPKVYQKYEKRIKNLEVRDDDIWISSFPKCGMYKISKLRLIIFA